MLWAEISVEVEEQAREVSEGKGGSTCRLLSQTPKERNRPKEAGSHTGKGAFVLRWERLEYVFILMGGIL